MSLPPDNPLPAAWAQDYPFARREVVVDGRWRMNLVDEAPADAGAPTLLFVHGNPTWSFHWRRLIEEVQCFSRCVAPDHIGCGLSEKPDESFRLEDRIRHLVELVDTLDLRNIIVVAQDWGGAIGLGTLLERRDRFIGAMLLNTGAFRPWFIPWRIRVCRTPLLGRIALQGMNLFSRAALRMTMSERTLEPQAAQAYLAPHDNWKHRRAVYDFVQDIPLSASHPTWATLGQIEDGLPSLSDLPIQLVWGMQDWCFTPECLERFRKVWPHARVRELHEAGHWVAEDAPEEVYWALFNFLQRDVPLGDGVVAPASEQEP